jgi:hypothetical protein
MHEIQYTRKALKGLRKMPSDVSDRFIRNFEQLVEGNEEGLNIKALRNRSFQDVLA